MLNIDHRRLIQKVHNLTASNVLVYVRKLQLHYYTDLQEYQEHLETIYDMEHLWAADLMN